MQGAIKIYRWLLKLYPAGFREEFGVPLEQQFRDDYRDAQGAPQRVGIWLAAITDLAVSIPNQLVHELTLDVRHAVRLYGRRWVTTCLTVLALGLAIGMSTGVFSVLNALLLRGLPFQKSEQLVELWLSPFTAFKGRTGFREWSKSNPYLQNAATFSTSDMNLAGGREALRVKATETSASFFETLGVQPVLGRAFSDSEDVFGHDSVAVISYGLWQQLFAGSPDVKGRELRINGAPFTVVGVMPAGFDYPAKTNIWMPTVFDFERVPKRGAFLFQTIGRLKEGVTIRQASGLFAAEVRRANPVGFPQAMMASEQNRPHLASLRDQLAGPVRQATWVLSGLTLLVLLIACANVAQLLLSRTIDRREELEMRAALGASRARLAQQLITEALLLTMSGAALGLFVAEWTARVSSAFAPAQLAGQQYTVVEWPVMAFAIGVALLTGVLFGLVPVGFLSGLQTSERTSRAKKGATTAGLKRARSGLVALQTAFALCLVTGSLSMGRTFLQLLNEDLGFHPSNVVTLNVSVQGTRRDGGAAAWQYYSQAIERLKNVPGVTAAAGVSHLPLATSMYMADSFHLDSGQKVDHVVTNAVTSNYFRAIGTKLLAGNDFTDDASTRAEGSVIVNEAFAQSTGLGYAIIGRKVIAPWSKSPYVVTGLVDTTSLAGPGSPGQTQIFWRVDEEPPPALTLVASVHAQPEDLLARCKDAVRSVDPAVPVYDVATFDQRVSEALARPRFYTTATIFLGCLALLLAAIGSYGTAAYSIAQRTHEIGVRMAVGASYQRVRAMVLREGMMPILCGGACGLVLSVAANRYLEHLLENASKIAFGACLLSAAFLLLTGAAAVWGASERILCIDPADALRAE